jgi:recombination protein RecA
MPTPEDIAAKLRKRLGPEAVSTAASGSGYTGNVVSTGALGLDDALGIGGLPMGRVVEVYGPEASGKTTLTLHVIANAQAAGYACGFVDAEHALDMSYAEALGVDPTTLLLSQPDTGEAGLNMVDAMIDEGVRAIVVDSVSALTPKAELEGQVGDRHVGLQARMMGQALRKITGKARRHDVLIVFINQLRMKIGVSFGSPETTSGGRALKFFASVRIDVRNIGKIKKSGQLYGHRCRLKTSKNKLAPPFRQVEVDLVWGRGFEMAGQLLDAGLDLGIVDKKGSWLMFAGSNLGHGRASAIELISTDNLTRMALKEAIKVARNGG